VGVCSIFVWYYVFSFFIRKFDIQTPGREADRMIKTDESENVMPDQKEAIESLIEGLGGRNNITSLENCFTRLRIELKDETKLNRDMINQFPNKGIIAKNATVQIIIGMKVQTVREEICAFLDME
jgi:PTS system maltose and glucose-specific IIC component